MMIVFTIPLLTCLALWYMIRRWRRHLAPDEPLPLNQLGWLFVVWLAGVALTLAGYGVLLRAQR